MALFKKIIVCCPGNSITGGPELLHQLVDAINQGGGDASILYYPLSVSYEIPTAYRSYLVKAVGRQEVPEDSVIVIPEHSAALTKAFRNHEIYVWWLSVDSFFGKRADGERSYWVYFKRLLKRDACLLNQLKNYKHLTQSYYAKEFLEKRGIESTMLSDYLNKEHFILHPTLEGRKKQVVYNPKKGKVYVDMLKVANPDIKFVPIQNMTPSEVSSLLRESMVYIDFGSHPGKDRIPREAAMAGCCVVTGQRGSAKNPVDIPISEYYKLSEVSPNFVKNFRVCIESIFESLEAHFHAFDPYRNRIAQEKQEFYCQVSDIFGVGKV